LFTADLMNDGVLCNDIHSKLNPTRVARVLRPCSTQEVVALVRDAAATGRKVSICGARHAMGGQQFGEGTLLLDCSHLANIGEVDAHGLIELGAGVKWRELVEALHSQQAGAEIIWTIRQKQTGADDLTLGGSLAANAHGRGLQMRPIIDDVEAFTSPLLIPAAKSSAVAAAKMPDYFVSLSAATAASASSHLSACA
jgi:FAD/FMN-containing dehydrogenase